MEKHIRSLLNISRGRFSLEQIILPFIGLLTFKYCCDISEKYGAVLTKKKFGWFVPKTKRFDTKISYSLLISNMDFFEMSNPKFQGTFTNIDFSKLDEKKTFSVLIEEISKIIFNSTKAGSKLFLFVMEQYSASLGIQGAMFTSPDSIIKVVAKLVTERRKPGNIYDATAGIGALLLKVGGKKSDLYGQEINKETYSLLRINMIMNGVHVDKRNFVFGNTLTQPGHIGMKFDTVVGNPPFSVKGDTETLCILEQRFKYKVPRSTLDFGFIQHMLSQLADDGMMALVVSTGVLFRGGAEKRIRQSMIEENVLDAVIVLPSKLYHSTGIPATILAFKKNRSNTNVHFIDASDQFIAGRSQNTLSDEHVNSIVDTYYMGHSLEMSELISKDTIINKEYSWYPPHYIDKFAKKIERLKVNYPKFTQSTFSQIIELEFKGTEVLKDDNSIYFSKTQSGYNLNKIMYDIDDLEGDSEDRHQIKFNDSIILSKYLTYFFKTELGSIYLDELQYKTGSTHWTRANKFFMKRKQLDEFPILLPKLKDQLNIVLAHEKLEKIKTEISLIQDDLSLTPKNAIQIGLQANDLLESIGKLSDAEYILSLTRKTESNKIEFKETFHICIHQKTHKDKKIMHSSLKNVAAFLNADGGDLLIGVHDNGTITGIDLEMGKKESYDEYKQYFLNQIKNKLGKQFIAFISFKLVDIGGDKVLRVKCKPASLECRIQEPEKKRNTFYVRANPSAEPLDGPALSTYIFERFKRS